MSHCLLKEQEIHLFKFLSVSLIFFQIKKNLKKNKISKKKKKNENKKFLELTNFRTQSMSVSANVSVRQSQDLGNATVR